MSARQVERDGYTASWRNTPYGPFLCVTGPGTNGTTEWLARRFVSAIDQLNDAIDYAKEKFGPRAIIIDDCVRRARPAGFLAGLLAVIVPALIGAGMLS